MKNLEQACAAVDRDPASVEVSAMWIPAMEGLEFVPRYADLGVDRLVVPLPVVAAGGDPLEGIDRFADEVLAKL